MAHPSAFINRIQSRSWKVLALAMVGVLLAFVLLFTWSTLSAEMRALMVYCCFAFFLSFCWAGYHTANSC